MKTVALRMPGTRGAGAAQAPVSTRHELEADAAARSIALPGVAAVPALSAYRPHIAARRSDTQAPALGQGRPLQPQVRGEMEQRFGHDFSTVRIHADAPAADILGARAFAVGRDVAFAPAEFRPDTTGGRALLAHELAHVVQQRIGNAGVQCEPKKGDSAAKQPEQKDAPAGVTLNIVIRAPDDGFTRDVVDYMRTTLKQDVHEVDNLEEAVAFVDKYASQNKTRVAGVRLVAHGSDTGGIKMTPKGETGRRFVTAEEIEKMNAAGKLRATSSQAMAEGATVEFWGCNIGRHAASTTALGDALGADVKAIDSTLATKHDEFVRPADHGEKGGTMTVISTSEIDFRVREGNKGLGKSFDAWLMRQAAKLEANGDLPPQKDKAVRLAEMRDLFDRSGGKIKTLVVRSGGTTVEKSNKKVWAQQWKTTKLK